jgi:hypothetical protein
VFRVRLAAEAFSFVTIRGVAGEPLKVVLLAPAVTPAVSAAAVALERAAYLLIMAVIVTVSALIATTSLALNGVWIRIFGGVAVASIVMIVSLLFVVSRPEPGSTRPRSPAATDTSSFVRRVGHEFVEQLRSLIRWDRRRLALLVGLETAAYALMALEVWIVLRATGTPITPLGAVAVETFTRVASMASAFIPANLGALEASNVAAASAVGAAAGAAALALVRRIRGLLWCVVGFAVYPRPHSRNGAERSSNEPPLFVHRGEAGEMNRPLIIVDQPVSDLSVTDVVGGLPIGERLARAAIRAGYNRLLIWSPRQRRDWYRLARRLTASASMTAVDNLTEWQRELGALNLQRPLSIVTSGFVPLTIDETGSLKGIRVSSRRDLHDAERELPVDLQANRRNARPVQSAAVHSGQRRAHSMGPTEPSCDERADRQPGRIRRMDVQPW